MNENNELYNAVIRIYGGQIKIYSDLIKAGKIQAGAVLNSIANFVVTVRYELFRGRRGIGYLLDPTFHLICDNYKIK